MDGDIPLVGDWNGDGVAKVGAFRPSDGVFYLDFNGNGQWDGCTTDRCLAIGMNGDIPLVGDWTSAGPAKVGVYRPSNGTVYLDYNGNGIWDGCETDRCIPWAVVPAIRRSSGSGDGRTAGSWQAAAGSENSKGAEANGRGGERESGGARGDWATGRFPN